MRKIDISGEELVAAPPQDEPAIGWVEISDLVIDDTYQRPLGKSNWAQIRKIAKDFRWSRFTPIMVAPIGGGRHAVIDGQHRVHAAAICGMKHVPAVIIDIAKEEQASTFSYVNGNVTRITVFHVYKAALAAREDWAVRSHRSVMRSGCHLMLSNASTNHKKAGQIFAIGLIRRLVERGRESAVETGLRALRDYDKTDRVPLYSNIILQPWLTAISERPDFEEVDLVAFLEKNDPFRVIDRVAKMRENGELKGASATRIERAAFVTLLDHFSDGAGSRVK